MEVLFFLAGVVFGGVGMFLIYRNNRKRFADAALEMDRKYAALKARIDTRR